MNLWFDVLPRGVLVKRASVYSICFSSNRTYLNSSLGNNKTIQVYIFNILWYHLIIVQNFCYTKDEGSLNIVISWIFLNSESRDRFMNSFLFLDIAFKDLFQLCMNSFNSFDLISRFVGSMKYWMVSKGKLCSSVWMTLILISIQN